MQAVAMSFCELAKTENSIDARGNNKDVREIDIHLEEVLRLIDPFDFTPTLISHSGFI